MNNTLKKRVMRRVYAIWFVRKSTPLLAETLGIALLGLWGMQYVSPIHVLANAFTAADGFRAFFVFFIRSFQHLSAPSQFGVAASGVLAVVMLRDIVLQTSRLSRFKNALSELS